MRRLALTLALLAAVPACKKGQPEAGAPLRLGFFPNLTHAQALVGNAEGLFARELGGPIAIRQFNAGPAAMEALLAGDVDVTYVGPGPAAIAYLRSQGAALKVVAGAASGGAALVARSARAPRELLGKRVASPQLGNTQDIALRRWLGQQHLPVGDDGAAVRVIPLSNPDILGLFGRGELEAAWVPEPWGARLLAEAGAHILVDERDLWEGRQFPTTVVVASRRALETRRADVVSILRAHLALTARWKADPAGFARAANAQYGKLTGHPLPDAVLQDAFSRLEPTADPLARQLAEGARHAQELDFAPPGDLAGMVDASPLEEARAAASR
ncbi:MAG TPA: ABC transporter substrate-binding protein [Anaeromyxobacteraceae bacterium]